MSNGLDVNSINFVAGAAKWTIIYKALRFIGPVVAFIALVPLMMIFGANGILVFWGLCGAVIIGCVIVVLWSLVSMFFG